MTSAVGIVVGQRQIEPAILIEVDELHTVRRIVFQDHAGQRLDERPGFVDEEGIAIERLAGDEIRDVQVGQAVVVQIAPSGRDPVAVQIDATAGAESPAPRGCG